MWRSLIDLLQIRGATFEPVSQYVQRDVRDILESRERFSVNKKTSATKLTPKKVLIPKRQFKGPCCHINELAFRARL